MARPSKTSATLGSCFDTTRFAVAYADFARAFRTLFDPYRPERHYMRGPGPRWQAKHGAASVHCR